MRDTSRTSERPTASLSLDLDNLWSYLKTHGDPGWEKRATYLPRFLPVALEALDSLDVSITFFVVGVDAARDENVPALQTITRAGHEVANHSHEHEPWLQRYSPQQLDDELAQAEAAIGLALGCVPRGFRGPGYSWSPALLNTLARRGYRYDASTLPTFLGPLARAYYFATARLTVEEREARRELFGVWTDGFRPNRPYEWSLDGGQRLLEIPVTVFPGLRTPFHLSYLLYLARFSRPLALAYWRSALTTCRLVGVEPSILLHPLDLIGADVAPELQFFPGMDVKSTTKLALFQEALGILTTTFDVVPMSEHAERLRRRGSLAHRAPPPPRVAHSEG